jgi:cell division protein FtsZ
MKGASDAVITVSNQRVLATLEGSTPATEVFGAADRLLVDGVRGLWELLTRPGLIQLDFASLERLLRGRHSESAFACVEATGENRAREVVDRLLASPFLANDTVLPVADAVLIAVTAGAQVPFAEIEGVLERIQAECRQAQVVVGTSVDPVMPDRMMVTLVASVGGSAPLPEVELSESLPESGGVNRVALDPEILGGEYLTGGATGGRSSGGLVPPAPELTLGQRPGVGGRPGLGKKKKVVQTTFNFEMVSRGRFEKTEATILHGEDLDIPTFLRRGVSLN